jgi:hypothetical protein
VGLVIACGGKEAGPGESCGAFFDELVAMYTQCGEPGLLAPAARGSFVDYCNALAAAPGVGDLAAEYAACSQNLDPSLCGGPQCSARGKLSAGTACTDGAQCASGVCVPTGQAIASSDQSCGTCGAFAEQGESCPQTPCDPLAGLYCTVAGTCQPRVATGGSCANGETCAIGRTCDAQTKTCQPLPSKGEPCTTDCISPYACISGVCADRVGASSHCTANECDLDLFCDPSSHTCVPAPPTSTPNELEGEPCTVGHDQCTPPLVCASGTCKVPDFTLCK